MKRRYLPCKYVVAWNVVDRVGPELQHNDRPFARCMELSNTGLPTTPNTHALPTNASGIAQLPVTQ